LISSRRAGTYDGAEVVTDGIVLENTAAFIIADMFKAINNAK